MPTSAWYQGESLKQLLQSAAPGAFATLGIGFDARNGDPTQQKAFHFNLPNVNLQHSWHTKLG
jgi:hypothetical protein